ncbi:ubiquitin carboxyl-terminal hydrolase CYLD-like [Branchiostoma lanceolatum]|uniref:ubiquitin carboxyl-terminal hydrolase CYLD-like n=1 Tax=Branchiostoma lanceolatum TaxID=7740 RepID=UPI0034539C82
MDNRAGGQKFILLKDHTVKTKSSRLSSLALHHHRDQQTQSLPGSLFEAIEDPDTARNGKKITLRSLENHNLILECPTKDVAAISAQEAELLIAIPTCKDRFVLYEDKDRLEEGLQINVNSVVEVSIQGVPTDVPGIVRYRGNVPGFSGITFGVELLDSKGKGTSDGTFRRKRFFQCPEDCGVFVALNKLRLRRDEHLRDLPNSTSKKTNVSKAVPLSDKELAELPLKVGMRVFIFTEVNGKESQEGGVVKYVGKLLKHGGDIYVGIELDNPVGNGSGVYEGERLFHARKDHAALVPLGGAIPAECMAADEEDKYKKLHRNGSYNGTDGHYSSGRQGAAGGSDSIPSSLGRNFLQEQAELLNRYSKSAERSVQHEASDSVRRKGAPGRLSPSPRARENNFNQSGIRHPPIGGSELLATDGCESGLQGMVSRGNPTEPVVPPMDGYFPRDSPNRSPSRDRVKYEPLIPGAAGGIATPPDTLERRAGVVDPTLEVGDMVEVLGTPPRYGVIKWVGNLPDIKNERLVAGIELDEELEACTDGTFKEKRYFTCPAKRGLFVFLDKCARDQRFEVPRPDEPPPSPSVAFGNYNAPTIQDDTLPPESLTLDLVGRAKGIQGHHNSCYLDATLYSMFAFSSVFDVLLHRPTSREDLPQYGEVQRLLRENIVNPLRVEGFVRADQTLKLRKLLDQLGSIPGLLSEEKDPEEFLTTMLKDVFKADPFLKIRSGSNKQEDCYFYQLFVEKDEKVLVPTVQQLLEQSCLATDIKITEMPSCLLVQMPRFGRDFKIYDRVIPSLTLDITDLLENVPRECTMCGSCGEVECKDCYMEKVFFQNNTSHIVTYCNICNLQSHKKRRGHKPTPIQVPESFRRRHDHSGLPVPRMTMDLFAVVCIQTSHYVAFVKCGNEPDAPWVFFDSMADRIGEQNGHNIPEVSEIHDLKQWLEDEEAITKQTDKELPEHVRRLLCDSYICMYQNRDVAMYK